MNTIKFKKGSEGNSDSIREAVDDSIFKIISMISKELLSAYMEGGGDVMEATSSAIELFDKPMSNGDKKKVAEDIIDKMLKPSETGLQEHYYDDKAVSIFSELCLLITNSRDNLMSNPRFKEFLKEALSKIED